MKFIDNMLSLVTDVRNSAGDGCYYNNGWQGACDMFQHKMESLSLASFPWIPCRDALPEEKINPVTNDYYVYPCIYRNGEVSDIRYYSFGAGKWYHGPGDMTPYVVAWFDIYNMLPGI